MANNVYPIYKTALLAASANVSLNVNTATDGPHVALHDKQDRDYTATDDFYNDMAVGTVGTPQQIANPTVGVVSQGTFDGDNVTFTAVVGDQCEALVIFRKNSGATSTQYLVVFLDTNITGLPVTPNGGNITVTWSTSGIFTL